MNAEIVYRLEESYFNQEHGEDKFLLLGDYAEQIKNDLKHLQATIELLLNKKAP